jgi:hypothetical protein
MASTEAEAMQHEEVFAVVDSGINTGRESVLFGMVEIPVYYPAIAFNVA